jgi:hypothetical protein
MPGIAKGAIEGTAASREAIELVGPGGVRANRTLRSCERG